MDRDWFSAPPVELSLYQTADPQEPQRWVLHRARLRKVDVKLCDPIVMLIRVDQHLLHTPMAIVFGRNYISVTLVASIWVQANTCMLGTVGLRCLPQSFGGP